MLKKIYTNSVLLTSMFVFIIWECTRTINLDNLTLPFIKIIPLDIVIYIIQIVVTYGFFQGISQFIIWILTNVRWFKKLAFGDTYIEGYWVGYYNKVNDGNRMMLCVEKYVQKPDEIIVTGCSYNISDKKLFATWNSNGAVQLNNNKIIFLFTNNIISENKTWSGISSFNLSKFSGNTIIDRMEGYSYSSYKNTSGRQSYTIQKKVAEISDNITQDELVDKALELYTLSHQAGS